MATRPKLSEAETLEQYRVSLENVEKQSEIAGIMSEFGYDVGAIAEGKDLLMKTREAYDFNKTEDDETSVAYYSFATKRHELAETYLLHRKKAKVVFYKDYITSDKLSISGILPRTYLKWLETAKRFYSVAMLDTDVQEKLARLKFATEDLTLGRNLIIDLEAARAKYLREKGESQAATNEKDKAFGIIDDWMREFYAVAKIAMDDKPQLLESLGKFVRG
ncbi:MAG: hypothetical protein ABFR62_04215 [Bacteroidota bacterium]